MVRVLGFDPGAVKSGWAIVEDGELLDYGFQRFASDDKELSFNDKVNSEVRAAVAFFPGLLDRVDAVCWEVVPSFGQMSQRERVISVATVLKAYTFERGLPFVGYLPMQVKKIFTGYGKAKKLDVRNKVEAKFPQLLELKKKMSPDVYDAIMIAYVGWMTKSEWLDE